MSIDNKNKFYYVRVNPKADEEGILGTYEKAEELRDMIIKLGFFAVIISDERVE